MDDTNFVLPNPTLRQSRKADSRAFESRVVEERAPIIYSSGSKFNLPRDLIESDPDHQYAFIRYSTRDKEDYENYDRAEDRGYEPIKRSDHPQFKRRYSSSPFGNRPDDDLIRRGGQIAMKRRKEYKIKEDADIETQNIKMKTQSEAHMQQDPRLPRVNWDRTTRVVMAE